MLVLEQTIAITTNAKHEDFYPPPVSLLHSAMGHRRVTTQDHPSVQESQDRPSSQLHTLHHLPGRPSHGRQRVAPPPHPPWNTQGDNFASGKEIPPNKVVPFHQDYIHTPASSISTPARVMGWCAHVIGDTHALGTTLPKVRYLPLT